jgi:intracellular sulfur oxidation DsrE/DsrF family protein
LNVHRACRDKVNFVLGNIENHFDGVGGPEHVTIALVVHGQALRAFGRRQIRISPGGSASSPKPGWSSPPAATP